MARKITALAYGRPGETSVDRDRRVRDMIYADPSLTLDALREITGVADNILRRLLLTVASEKRRGCVSIFVPPQKFTPSPPVPPTPDERLRAIPVPVRRAIAARYGVQFREMRA